MTSLSVSSNSAFSPVNSGTAYTPFSELTLLGEGTYSSVYKAVIKESGQTIALKVNKPKQKYAKALVHEASMLKLFNGSSFFPKFFGSNEVGEDVCALYEEFFPEPDLFHRFLNTPQDHQKLTWEAFLSIAVQHFPALHELRLQDIYHNDLKPENEFYHNGCLKIADLGIAKKACDMRANSPTHTLSYRPPEVVLQFGANRESDVYSAGIVLADLAVGQCILPSQNEAQHFLSYVYLRGAPPAHWLDKSKEVSALFKKTTEGLFLEMPGYAPSPVPKDVFYPSLVMCMEKRWPSKKSEIPAVASLIDEMTRWENRISLEKGFDHPAFRPYLLLDLVVDANWKIGDEALLYVFPAKTFFDKGEETPLLSLDLAKSAAHSRHMLPRAQDNFYLVMLYDENGNELINEVVKMSSKSTLVLRGDTFEVRPFTFAKSAPTSTDSGEDTLMSDACDGKDAKSDKKEPTRTAMDES